MSPRLKELSKLIPAFALVFLFSACEDKDGTGSSTKNHSSTPIKCRWDFSTSGKVYEYDYVQSMAAPGSNSDTRMEAEGTLVVRSEEDGTAVVELNDATVTMGEQQQKMPNFSFSGLKDDGTAPMSDGSQDAMIRMLLPVPLSALTPGESSSVEIQFPTRFNSSVGYTPVLITMELNDIDRSEGQGVANFSVKFVSGKVVATSGGDFPEDFNMRINGSGTMRFNFEHGQHLGSALTVNIESPSFQGQKTDKMSTEISLTPKPKR